MYPDSLAFLDAVKLPVYILSNIDCADIMIALAQHHLSFAQVITSEDVRSYKPRAEMFHAALQEAALEPHEVLHVGDSVSSDVAGACAMGIPVAGSTEPAKLWAVNTPPVT